MPEYDYLSVSDGSGDAALMHVDADRSIGSLTLVVDTISNVPAKFIATSGTLLPSGLIDPADKCDFMGHLSGADIVIDDFMPGSVDAGNTEGQIVVIKPNTSWVDGMVEMAQVAHNDDGTIKAAAVDAEAVAVGAIKLGYASRTSDFSTSSASFVDVTDLTLTFDVPVGGRDIEIIGFAKTMSTSGAAGTSMLFGIFEDGVQIGGINITEPVATYGMPCMVIAQKTPTPGPHTYKLQAAVGAGTLVLSATSVAKAFISAKLV